MIRKMKNSTNYLKTNLKHTCTQIRKVKYTTYARKLIANAFIQMESERMENNN